MPDKKIKKIIFSGGGTGGSVSPLLAIADTLRNSEKYKYEFLWVGTKNGIEKQMVDSAGIPFKSISAGKFRRYLSFKNISDLFKVISGFFQSIPLIINEKPDLIMSAGGFVSVPLAWAAWVLRKKIIIHQQDFRPGLANKLMSPFADVITTVFEKSVNDYGEKAIWTGNSIRYEFLIEAKKEFFNLNSSLPLVLVVGGGTGSTAINEILEKSLKNLLKFCQIIHITGKEKRNINKNLLNYYAYEFVEVAQMSEAMKKSELVVSRAGMSFLSELSNLGKPSILIPMPDTHQEENAGVFQKEKAAIVLKQRDLNPGMFVFNIKSIIKNQGLRSQLSLNIKKLIKPDGNKNIVVIIEKALK